MELKIPDLSTICCLNRSPVDSVKMSYFLTRRADNVPLPAPRLPKHQHPQDPALIVGILLRMEGVQGERDGFAGRGGARERPVWNPLKGLDMRGSISDDFQRLHGSG
jgi:hypothetical protein